MRRVSAAILLALALLPSRAVCERLHETIIKYQGKQIVVGFNFRIPEAGAMLQRRGYLAEIGEDYLILREGPPANAPPERWTKNPAAEAIYIIPFSAIMWISPP